MTCLVKTPAVAPPSLAASDLRRRLSAAPRPRFLALSAAPKTPSESPPPSVSTPLHLAAIKGLALAPAGRVPARVACAAYEADRSEPVAPRSEAAQKFKIGVYFATWWALNVVFNIYNKKVLNAFPYPWLTSTLSLAAGSLIMLLSWATRIAEAPKIDLDFWKALAPVRTKHLLVEGICLLLLLVRIVDVVVFIS